MELIKNIDKLLDKINYTYTIKYSDNQLNNYFNYWYFFDTQEVVVQELTSASIEKILYSKYYWSSRYIDKFNKLYGEDKSVEQQRYKILEDMDQRLGKIDWNFVQRIHEGKV